jgi:hypothetical protein
VVALQNESLTDDDDADSPVFRRAYKVVPLTRLDDRGTTLQGAYANNISADAVRSRQRVFLFGRSQDGFEQVMAYYSITTAEECRTPATAGSWPSRRSRLHRDRHRARYRRVGTSAADHRKYVPTGSTTLSNYDIPIICHRFRRKAFDRFPFRDAAVMLLLLARQSVAHPGWPGWAPPSRASLMCRIRGHERPSRGTIWAGAVPARQWGESTICMRSGVSSAVTVEVGRPLLARTRQLTR